jgi:hypothetical protein
LNKLLRITIPILVMGLVLVAGCSAPKQSSVPPAPMPAPAPMPPPGVSRDYTSGAESQFAPVETGETDIDRKIVRTGYLTLEVNDIDEALADIARVARELNGYVVSSNKQENKDTTYGSVSIRVPADRFDEAFDRLHKLAVKVPRESTESQDVTEEYTDLQAQLRNLEATEAQYLELLKKAETVEDTLKVYQALSDVRRQIEQIKGRIQYLERTSDMALIEVNLQKTKPIEGTAWSALETLKSAVRGLISFGKVLANIAIWLVIFCPVWIIILVLVLYFTRWRRKKAKSPS